MRPRFLYKSTCSTCRKARALLAELGIETDERDMSKSPLSAEEVRDLLGEREIKPFLNTRTDEYRERNMKANVPSREEAIESMAANPNLIRRPLLILKDRIVFGYDEGSYRDLVD